MQVFEVFYDYACPFCLRGHEALLELIPQFSEIVIEWRPCEAHPRPERYGRHSDLCARGMYFVLENSADLMEYHSRMYNAALTDCMNIEDVNVILDITDGLIDKEKLSEALISGLYENRLSENNHLAWDIYDFPAVPSYRMGGVLLKSKLGVGVGKERLETFLKKQIGKVG